MSENIIVIPRLGTISPWSSKATDIVHLCGMTEIKRIERGIIYHFNRQITKSELFSILKVVMDKMTESHLKDLNDVNFIFDELKPKSFNSIDILTQGKSAINNANIELGLALSGGEIDYLYSRFK